MNPSSATKWREFATFTGPPLRAGQRTLSQSILARKLGIQAPEVMRALVYQNAACNWRCWYCYVPFELLAADESRSSWLSAQEMVDLYLETPERPRLIDLSGGQPDLVPEWTLQMMRALTSKGVERDSYLWSDDNLSNDYFRLTRRRRRSCSTDSSNCSIGCLQPGSICMRMSH